MILVNYKYLLREDTKMFGFIKKLFGFADVNKDGKVDGADAKVVAQKVEAEVKEAAVEVKAEVKKTVAKAKAGAKKVADKAKPGRKPKVK